MSIIDEIKTMTVKGLLINQFLEILDQQGFNTCHIAPYLKVTVYNEFGSEVDRYPIEEDSIRFEVQYPDMNPICQYCGWVAGQLVTRDEWFLSIPGYDRVFGMDKGESIESFYNAFSHASTTAMLNRLDIPTYSPPWHKGE